MAKKVIRAQMQQRRDTAANWAASNPVLLDGELGIVTDNPNLYKIGDGATAWNDLKFRGFDGTLAQTTGDSENAVMSQKAVTEKLTELESEVSAKSSLLRKVFALTSGVAHSSNSDRLYCRVNKGEKYNLSYYSEGNTYATLYILYEGETSTSRETVLTSGKTYTFEAAKNIISFGVYIEPTQTSSATLTLQSEPYVSDMENVNKKINAVEDINKNLLKSSPCFGVFLNNSKIELDKDAGLIKFPEELTIGKGNQLYKAAACELSIVCTDWDGNPVASSLGYILYHIEKQKLMHIYYGLLSDDAPGIIPIAMVKRTMSSTEYIGEVANITSLLNIAEQKGSEDENIDTIIARNFDIESICDAMAFPKYGKTTRLTFLHASDTHGDETRHMNAIKFMNRHSYIVGMFNTGDIQPSNATTSIDWFTNSIKETDKLITLTLGNHDVGNSKDVSICVTAEGAYNKYIKPIESHNSLVTNGKNYWYRDFSAQKIRVISIYEYDNEDVLKGTYRIKRGVRALSQEQITWFGNLLLNTPTDYAVIVLTHQNPTTARQKLAFNEEWSAGDAVDSQNVDDGQILPEIIDAWMRGVAINKTWGHYGDGAYLPEVSINVDYSNRGAGEFIGWFFGHSHLDAIGTIAPYPSQHWFAVTCATADAVQSQFDDLPRVIGSKSEDAINIVSIDRDERSVYLLRVGASMTKNFKERKYLKVTY